MKGFSTYYIEALVVCTLLFLILLIHNHNSLDRQVKQIKFDRALVAFILYFIADGFWAAIVEELIPKTRVSVLLDTFALYVLMAAICYCWLEYVMAVEQLPHRNRRINKFAVIFPFMVSTGALIVHYLIAPQTLINDELEAQFAYSVYLMASPIVYLGAILFYTLKRAAKEENPMEKRKHLFIGFFPLSTIAGGIIQEAFFPYIPIYCFVNALLLLIFYIQSIQAQISLDPLTSLNNRGELTRYSSQKANLHQENRLNVVIMMDINSFKTINDTYGHAEGDKALIIIADALKKVTRSYSMPSFLGRYGGDEFILIVHPPVGTDVKKLIEEIRGIIDREIERAQTRYPLSVSIGYNELKGKEASIQESIRLADKRLYQDKARFKAER